MAQHAINPANETIPFETHVYLAANPDVAATGMNAFAHWLAYGRDEERNGQRKNAFAPHFDSAHYLSIYPDAATLVRDGRYVSAAEHWQIVGRREVIAGARPISAEFDAFAYLQLRPDLKVALPGCDIHALYDHWLCWARHEMGSTAARPRRVAQPASISNEKAAFWAERGYLILEGLISPGRCDALDRRMGALWAGRSAGIPAVSADIYIDRQGARRVPFAEAPDDARSYPYKLNDMVMYDPVITDIALDERLCEVLAWVLDDAPVAIGSLNFERSSTQEFHTDTLYMSGETVGGMTAAWIALEDVSPHAGPLHYYPGSHRIPLFLFSDGRPFQKDEEFGNYRAYMHGQVAERQLVSETFLPKKGDVLIWHEKLFHAGGKIDDITLTRKSLVVHYWRRGDMTDKRLKAAGGGYFWDRPPLT